MQHSSSAEVGLHLHRSGYLPLDRFHVRGDMLAIFYPAKVHRLVRSIRVNGYFPTSNLVVVAECDDGVYIIDGLHRFMALRILSEDNTAAEIRANTPIPYTSFRKATPLSKLLPYRFQINMDSWGKDSRLEATVLAHLMYHTASFDTDVLQDNLIHSTLGATLPRVAIMKLIEIAGLDAAAIDICLPEIYMGTTSSSAIKWFDFDMCDVVAIGGTPREYVGLLLELLWATNNFDVLPFTSIENLLQLPIAHCQALCKNLLQLEKFRESAPDLCKSRYWACRVKIITSPSATVPSSVVDDLCEYVKYSTVYKGTTRDAGIFNIAPRDSPSLFMD